MERRTTRTSTLAALAAAMALASLASAAPRPDGEPTDPECGTFDDELPAQLPPLQATTGGVETRRALLVHATFPNIAAWGEVWIPSWLPAMAGEGVPGTFEEYMTAMSEGALDLQIDFARRPPPLQDEPYMASMPDSAYGPLGYGVVNAEILLQVQADHPEHPDFLSQFDYAFMVYNGNPFSGQQGGFSGLGLPADFPSAFGGSGFTARLLWPGFDIESDDNRRHSEWVQIHELGHVRGLGHTPLSDPDGPCPKKQAGYAPMQAHVPHGGEWGYKPYHLKNLIKLGWFTRIVDVPRVAGQSQSFTLADLRAGGSVLKVHLAEWNGYEEYLLVANHQGTDYDAAYLGTGLLVWHVRDNLSGGFNDRWDLELPGGRFDAQGQPEPEGGTDLLDDTGRSHASDFWTTGSFGPSTNPTTAVMQPSGCPLERASSGVTIDDITVVGTEVDLTVSFASVPPPVAAVVATPPETYLGLTCEAAQVFQMPLAALVTDPDGSPIPDVPAAWLKFVLRPTFGTLDFCAGNVRGALADTDASGVTSALLYHACGGGEFEADLEVLGLLAGTSPAAKLRTADLNADARVDIIDLGIWANPSGPIEDDIRDLNFDLAINILDLSRFAGELNAELEGEVTVELLTPNEGAVLPLGSTTTLAASACAVDGSSPTLTYRRVIDFGITTLGGGSSYDWLVVPPLGGCTLQVNATTTGLGGASDSISVDVVAPDVVIAKVGNTPIALPNVGDQGTVRFRLTNHEAVALSQLRGALRFPNGDLTVVAGPTPANPHALAPGASVVLEWTVQRVLPGGGATAEVRARLVGYPDVLALGSFTVFGGTVGGGF